MPAITVSAWDKVNARYNEHAARGPDGFDKQDLLRMPIVLKERMVQLLNHVEDTAQWPQQLLQGFGIPVPKETAADTINKFRPIIVLSTVYRSWSSLRAKVLIHFLEKFVGPNALGFLPGREAGQIWLYIQASVEFALQGGQGLVGLTTDVSKAFESIPRRPLMATCHHLGVPARVLRPWDHFLSNFQRRFVHNGQISEPLTSTSGLPEGDSLAVMGMCVIDWVFDLYMSRFAPAVIPKSFVDNYELMATNAYELLHGYAVMQTYMDLWQLQLDEPKTFAWATSSQDRSHFRRLGLRVKTTAVDLGGALTFSRARSVQGQLERFKAIEPCWARLRRLPMDLHTKQKIIRQALWPAALHAIAVTPMAEDHIGKLRTQAARALGWKAAGSQPMIRLSLGGDHPCLDPGFYQLLTTFMDFKRILIKEPHLLHLWQRFMRNYDGESFSGPYGKILEQATLVQWTVLDPPLLLDHDGLRVDILSIPQDWLYKLLQDAWYQRVARFIQPRTEFAGLVGLQWPPSRTEKAMGALEVATINALRDGSFMTRNIQGKFDLAHGYNCDLCQQPDSMEHRCRECLPLTPLRERHQWVMERWDTWPCSLRIHLLPNRNAHFREIKHALAELQDRTLDHHLQPGDHSVVDIFTDGSCWNPNDPDRSLAAWAAVSASHQSVLAKGPLCGPHQSIDRAELTAALAAVSWLARTGVKGTLWIDNSYVAQTLNQIAHDPTNANIHSHEDLWEQTSQFLEMMYPGQLSVVHVSSHQADSDSTDPLTDWIIFWNRQADAAAGHAHTMRTSSFRTLWDRYDQATRRQRQEVDYLRAFHLDLAATRKRLLSDSAHGEEHLDPDEDCEAPRIPLLNARPVSLPDSLSHVWNASACATRFGQTFPHQFLNWLREQQTGAHVQHRVAWVELAAALFLSDLSHPLPAVGSDPWVDASQGRGHDGSILTVAARVRFVSSLVKALARELGISFEFVHGLNRLSLGFGMPLHGVVLGLSPCTLDKVDHMLRLFNSSRTASKAGDLARPFARR